MEQISVVLNVAVYRGKIWNSQNCHISENHVASRKRCMNALPTELAHACTNDLMRAAWPSMEGARPSRVNVYTAGNLIGSQIGPE